MFSMRKTYVQINDSHIIVYHCDTYKKCLLASDLNELKRDEGFFVNFSVHLEDLPWIDIIFLFKQKFCYY